MDTQAGSSLLTAYTSNKQASAMRKRPDVLSSADKRLIGEFVSYASLHHFNSVAELARVGAMRFAVLEPPRPRA